MWNQLYLETCCRSALHRLVLSGPIGRPAEEKDGGCLDRLADGGLAQRRPDGRFEATPAGKARHDQDVGSAVKPVGPA
ncbi:MAG: hypothetical protein HIU82_06755 [Proteobacteria bacterium]|nr:hypothetical protein [Pseudomonadota bacterium]